MTTSVPPALPSSPTPKADSPSRVAEGNGSGTAHTFSEVLSQQHAPAHKTTGATSDPNTAASPRSKAASLQDPDTTLSLILDSAALALMVPPGQPAPAEAPPRAVARASGSAALQAVAPQAGGAAAALALDVDTGTDTATLSMNPAGPTPEHSAATQHPRAALPAAVALTGHDTAANRAAEAPLPPGTTAPAEAAAASLQAVQSPMLAPPALPVALHDATANIPADTPAPQEAASSALGFTALAPQLPSALSTQGPAITLAVATPLTSPQWAQEFGQQILSLTQSRLQGLHTVQLQVNPPDLGPVHITLQIGDTTTQAAFMSPHAHVRQVLENALPNLAQQFAQAGLSLGQANVSDQGRQGFGQTASGSQENHSAAFRVTATSQDGMAPAPLLAQAPLRVMHPESLVDTFV